MPSQPPLRQPEPPALRPTLPASNLSRRAAFRGIGGGLSAALLLAAAPRSARADSEQADAPPASFDPPATVVGAWDLTFSRVDSVDTIRSTRLLATFGAEGGFQAALPPAGLDSAGSPRFHGGGHGSWTTDDDGVVVARYTAMTYDVAGVVAGTRHVDLTIAPENRGSLFGAYESRLHDADGTLVDLVSGTVTGIVAGIPATGSRGYPSVTVPASNDVAPQLGQPGWPF